jgi:hypothetical protein
MFSREGSTEGEEAPVWTVDEKKMDERSEQGQDHGSSGEPGIMAER